MIYSKFMTEEIRSQGMPPTLVAGDFNGDEACFDTMRNMVENEAWTDLGKTHAPMARDRRAVHDRCTECAQADEEGLYDGIQGRPSDGERLSHRLL